MCVCIFVFDTNDTVTEHPGVKRIATMAIRIFLTSESRVLTHLFEKSFLLEVYLHISYTFHSAFCRTNTHVRIYCV